jgi:hypothetical protein
VTDPADAPLSADEVLALARRFEPVLRFTEGELFLPMKAEDYVRGAALYRRVSGAKEPKVVIPAGELDADRLAAYADAHPGDRLELHFVDEPLDRKAYKQWRRRPDRAVFKGRSRFAAVGLLGRLVDAFLRFSLVIRGKVPGGFAAAAEINYQASGAAGRPAYHVRASRDAGYLVLQYWFCYAMNDWRSTFSGVNDHEADWEQITLFLIEPDPGADGGPSAGPQLAWVAFSSHDEVGDDLRRRVDDPDLQLVDGTHPVVYAGAGSHSGAYLPGDYIVSVAPPAVDRWVSRWYKVMGFLLPWTRGEEQVGIGIPFIDYRRGDGPAVGPGTDLPWTPVVIDDDTPWVASYRGLGGYDTRDPFGGERAPAGPRYERNASVRPSWDRPVAWAGLDKVPPTGAAARAALARRADEIDAELAQAQTQLEARIEELRTAHEGSRAVRARGTRHETAAEVAAQEAVDAARAQVAALRAERDAVDAAVERGGLPPDPVHAHLRHRTLPDVDEGKPVNAVMRLWSSISVSVLLIGLAAVLFFELDSRLWGLIGVVVLVLGIDAAARGHFGRFLATVLTLFIVADLIALLILNVRVGTAALLLVAAIALIVSNLTAYLRSR